MPRIDRATVRLLLGSIVLAFAGCGERPAPRASAPGQPLEIATAQADTETSAAPIAPRVYGASSFAPSPMTAFANQVTELIGTVIDGRPPPSGPLPLVPWQNQDHLLKSRARGPAPRRADLEFVVFGMELQVVLSEDSQAPIAAPGAPTAAPAPGPTAATGPDEGRLETITFLSRTGLKIAKLNVRSPSPAHPLPPWLAGAKQFGTEIFDAARRGTLERLLVGEPERPVLDNELLFAQLLKELPERQELERAQALAKTKGDLLGLRFDDVYVIARDKHGDIWGFKLEIEEHKGQLAFETSPLVEVSRLELEHPQ